MGAAAMAEELEDESRIRRPAVDRETLIRCKARDPQAFRVFVVAHQCAVFALLSHMLGPGPHVEDLAQEVFFRAYRAFPNFDLDGAARPSSWLLTIAVRLAINARKQKPPPLIEYEHALRVSHSSTPETERARRELGQAIERAAAELSDDQRAVFVLSQYHGMSGSEIADALQIALSTVKTRLFRARSHMRGRLEPIWKGNAR